MPPTKRSATNGTVWILSYPRSGNHLVRTFVEYMTKRPTIGRYASSKDCPIFQRNERTRKILQVNADREAVALKAHFADDDIKSVLHEDDKLLLILRSPTETFLSHKSQSSDGTTPYLNNIRFYKDFKNQKLLLYYEDMKCVDKNQFIVQLGRFFGCTEERIDDAIRNRRVIEQAALSALVRKPQSQNDVHFYAKKHHANSFTIPAGKDLQDILSRYKSEIRFV